MTTNYPERVAFRVHGTPIPQGSKVANTYGRGVRDANAAKLIPWRKQVTETAQDWCRFIDCITVPVRVWVRFTFDRPRSHYGTGRNSDRLRQSANPQPTSRSVGDLDKLVRAVLDAITDARVWDDDAQVVDLRARKFYAGEDELAMNDPGVEVIIEPLTDPVRVGGTPPVTIHVDPTMTTSTNWQPTTERTHP